MRQTHVPRKVTKCTKLLVAQCSPEPALTSTDFRAPENLFFQPLEGQSLVWCLKLPFGIHELQELESTWDAVFYDTVYNNDDYKPTLKAFGRGWHYIYGT